MDSVRSAIKAARVSFRELYFLFPLPSAFLILLFTLSPTFYTWSPREEKCGRSGLSYHSAFAAHRHVPVNKCEILLAPRATNPAAGEKFSRSSFFARETAAKQCRGNNRCVKVTAAFSREWEREEKERRLLYNCDKIYRSDRYIL